MSCHSISKLIFVLAFALSAEAKSHHKTGYIEVDPATVAMPADNEVCFSPDEPCAAKLIRFVDSAQKTVDLAIYDINLDGLVHTLLMKSKKVTLRLVVDERQAKGRNSAVSLLRKAGVQLRYGHQRGIMHNKFALIDGKRIEIGSFNYTHHAAFANQENQIYLSTPAVVERYHTRFEKIWREAKDPGSLPRGLSSVKDSEI